MADNREPPRVFISYSWTSPEYQERVIDLAERLQNDGVHIVIDVWDLKAGHDKYAFMEQMVTDQKVKKVLIAVDRQYAKKADNREGGVGSESQIISADLYGQVSQEKFIPIVMERDEAGTIVLPAYLASRIYRDLSNNSNFAANYELLLRDIYERPARQRPALGVPPAFLDESLKVSSAAKFALDRAVEAIERGERQAQGYLRRFLDHCHKDLEAFGIREAPNGEFDDAIVQRIHDMTPLRDQLLKAFDAICQFEGESPVYQDLQSFLENAAPLLFRPEGLNQYSAEWFDHYRFFFLELVLYLTAILIRHKRYEQVNMILDGDYSFNTPDGAQSLGIAVFDMGCKSLDEWRKQRLNLNRFSVIADMIKDRSPSQGIDFAALIQADIILALKSIFAEDDYLSWYPRTAPYLELSNQALPLFVRFKSGKKSDAVGTLFGIDDPIQFQKKLSELYVHHKLENWRAGYRSIPFFALTGVSPPEGLGRSR